MRSGGCFLDFAHLTLAAAAIRARAEVLIRCGIFCSRRAPRLGAGADTGAARRQIGGGGVGKSRAGAAADCGPNSMPKTSATSLHSCWSAARRRARLAYRFGSGRFADQVGGIHAPEQEKQAGILVELGAHTVKRSSDVFAQVCPVRTGTIQVNFLRRRKKASFAPGNDLHHRRREFALEQFNQGIDFAGAFGLDGFPKARSQRLDLDVDRRVLTRRPGRSRSLC